MREADAVRGAGERLFRRVVSALRPVFEGRPWLDPVALGVLAFVGAAAVGLLGRMPVAFIHDEFAYLLMGETFASGRLTNPTPPFWEHLETFHVLMVPTYMGKYPPAQGMVLAVGFLLGHPILGVWLSCAAMVAAVTWMLQAWLPREWAAAGGTLVLLQVGIVGYWAQGYWGGAVAAIGGTLVYGAARRLWERPRVAQGLVLGIGLLILANSRPLEGLVASLPVAVVLAVRLARAKGWSDRLRLTVPTAAVLIPGFVWMGVYNDAVTGSATTMPYQEYGEQYAAAPNLVLLGPPADPPEYRHPEFRQFWADVDVAHHVQRSSPVTLLREVVFKSGRNLVLLLGPALLGLLFLRPSEDLWMAIAAAGVGMVWLLSALTPDAWPHYVAPIAGALIFLTMAGWRSAVRMDGAGFRGRRIFLVAVVVCLLAAPARVLRYTTENHPALASQLRRAEIDRCLRKSPRPSLVLVERAGPFVVFGDWVWNRPEPFDSHVVWARSMEEEKDSTLAASVPARTVWKVDIDYSSESASKEGWPALQLVRGPAGSPAHEPVTCLRPSAASSGGGDPR